MLDLIIELISTAASNSLAVFCLCNLIIGILLAGSLKPSLQFHEKKPYAFSTVVTDDNLKKFAFSSGEKASTLIVTAEEEKLSSLSIDMIGSEDESPGEEEADDGELRKRVEEFIDKINRGWRAEKQNTYSLGQ